MESSSLPMVNVLAQVLDAAALRQRVIAQNVANVNTPGYKRLEVAFEAEMARALAVPGVGDSVRVTPKVVVGAGPERVDGNTVDLSREMNDLNKNYLLYEAATQIIASRVSQQRSAITGQ